MKQFFSLENKVVIITGGAGHLGREISKAMAAHGATVYSLGRDPAKLQALAFYNSEFSQPRIFTQQLDISDDEKFREFVDQVFDRHGHIDCLVNHASSARREKWEDLDKASWLQGLDGTLTHYFTCTQAVSKHMLKKGSCSIINTASMMAFLAPHFPMHLDMNNSAAAHHSVAKGGVLQLTRHLAALWGRHGVRVNAISPGYFPQKRGPERLDYMHELTIRIPMGRIGQPSDLAPMYVFLASDASSYITGQNIIVDGGFSIW